jgi:hypothetical protein
MWCGTGASKKIFMLIFACIFGVADFLLVNTPATFDLPMDMRVTRTRKYNLPRNFYFSAANYSGKVHFAAVNSGKLCESFKNINELEAKFVRAV